MPLNWLWIGWIQWIWWYWGLKGNPQLTQKTPKQQMMSPAINNTPNVQNNSYMTQSSDVSSILDEKLNKINTSVELPQIDVNKWFWTLMNWKQFDPSKKIATSWAENNYLNSNRDFALSNMDRYKAKEEPTINKPKVLWNYSEEEYNGLWKAEQWHLSLEDKKKHIVNQIRTKFPEDTDWVDDSVILDDYYSQNPSDVENFLKDDVTNVGWFIENVDWSMKVNYLPEDQMTDEQKQYKSNKELWERKDKVANLHNMLDKITIDTDTLTRDRLENKISNYHNLSDSEKEKYKWEYIKDTISLANENIKNNIAMFPNMITEWIWMIWDLYAKNMNWEDIVKGIWTKLNEWFANPEQFVVDVAHNPADTMFAIEWVSGIWKLIEAWAKLPAKAQSIIKEWVQLWKDIREWVVKADKVAKFQEEATKVAKEIAPEKVIEKSWPTKAELLIEKQLKFTKPEKRKYKAKHWETQWQTLNNRWHVGDWEEVITKSMEDMQTYKNEKEAWLEAIHQKIPVDADVIKMTEEVAENSRKTMTPSELEASWWKSKYDALVEKAKKWELTHTELEDIKSTFERKKALKYDGTRTSEEKDRLTRLDSAVRVKQQKRASEAWFDNIKDINKEISKTYDILKPLSKDVEAIDWLWFTDHVLLATSFVDPHTLVVLAGKKLAQSNWFKKNTIKILNKLNGKKPVANKVADIKAIKKISNEAELNEWLAKSKHEAFKEKTYGGNPALPSKADSNLWTIENPIKAEQKFSSLSSEWAKFNKAKIDWIKKDNFTTAWDNAPKVWDTTAHWTIERVFQDWRTWKATIKGKNYSMWEIWEIYWPKSLTSNKPNVINSTSIGDNNIWRNNGIGEWLEWFAKKMNDTTPKQQTVSKLDSLNKGIAKTTTLKAIEDKIWMLASDTNNYSQDIIHDLINSKKATAKVWDDLLDIIKTNWGKITKEEYDIAMNMIKEAKAEKKWLSNFWKPKTPKQVVEAPIPKKWLDHLNKKAVEEYSVNKQQSKAPTKQEIADSKTLEDKFAESDRVSNMSPIDKAIHKRKTEAKELANKYKTEAKNNTPEQLENNIKELKKIMSEERDMEFIRKDIMPSMKVLEQELVARTAPKWWLFDSKPQTKSTADKGLSNLKKADDIKVWDKVWETETITKIVWDEVYIYDSDRNVTWIFTKDEIPKYKKNNELALKQKAEIKKGEKAIADKKAAKLKEHNDVYWYWEWLSNLWLWKAKSILNKERRRDWVIKTTKEHIKDYMNKWWEITESWIFREKGKSAWYKLNKTQERGLI